MQTLTNQFTWQQSDGTLSTPAQMRTTHLFYVIRMLYHNMTDMPVVCSEPMYYRLNRERFTDEYVRDALYAIATELSERDDLPKSLVRQLTNMQAHIDKRTRNGTLLLTLRKQLP